MKFRSHNVEEIRDIIEYEQVWELDTGTDGEDDVLYGPHADVLREICYFHSIDKLPENWTLIRVTAEEFEAQYPDRSWDLDALAQRATAQGSEWSED